MISHHLINAETCSRVYVTVYAICLYVTVYLHISKALGKLVSNLHPQSSASCRHLIHIVMICSHSSCRRGPSFPHMIDPIMQQIPARNHWDVLHSGVSQTNPCNPGAPNKQFFYLSGTHLYGMIFVPRLGACRVSNFGGLQSQRYQKFR